MKINRKKLLKKYMEKINKISNDLPEKSYFWPREIVEIICDILENEKL